MARWRLMEAHYLNVPDNEWEYKEETRTKGKPIRKRLAVPRLLDPNDPSDCNYDSRTEGPYIVVCWEDKGQPEDIVFVGDPTPSMKPLDAEATAVSKSMEAKWKMKELPANGISFDQALISGFEKALTDAMKGNVEEAKPANVAVGGVDSERLAKLEQMVINLMRTIEEQQGTIAALAGAPPQEQDALLAEEHETPINPAIPPVRAAAGRRM